MKISVIIPIYNVEPYVERCLRSVMDQTYRGTVECIIVDDCGSDGSMDRVNQMVFNYQGPIQFKILHHDHNRGLSAARNTGIDTATGEYVFFLDSDDEIFEYCLEKLVEPLKEEQYDVVVRSVCTKGNNGRHQWLMLKLQNGDVLRGKAIETHYYTKWNMMAQNKLYRLAFLRQQNLRFKEGLVHEDDLWSLQVACLAQSLRAVNMFTYVYYVREGSITQAANAKVQRCEMLKIITVEICKFLKDRKIFSVKAYQLMLKYFQNSFELSQHDRTIFVREYCELRKAALLPMSYHIRACGMHPRAQLHNLYYLLPPRLAAQIIFKRNYKKN